MPEIKGKAFREEVTESFAGQPIASKLHHLEEDELEKAQAQFEAGSKCDHRYVRDEPGWLYDYRYCAVCGAGMGAI